MTQPARRLIAFVLGIVLSICIMEWVVRSYRGFFVGASERGRAELAVFKKSPAVDILYFGTSRTHGGVSPSLVQLTLNEIAPELGSMSGYNAAFPGASIAMLTSIGPDFVVHPGPRLVVLELSAPQITNASPAWEDFRPQPATTEEKLAESFQSLAFVHYRSALSRVPGLISYTFSLALLSINKPSPVTVPVAAKSKPIIAVTPKEEPAIGFDIEKWKPDIFTPASKPQSLDSENDRIANKLAFLAHRFKEAGVKVVFASPPLTRGEQKTAPEKSMRPLFSEVARRGQCEVWNFSRLAVRDTFFYNPSHLNATGRAHYSRALAIQLARLMKEKE